MDIGEDVKLLREVKDIRDELNIIKKVFSEQLKVLEDFKNTIKVEARGGINDAMQAITGYQQEILLMDDDANKTYQSVRFHHSMLLSHSQKINKICSSRTL